jgi:3-phosphoshikimate 1-carboxyvinyltransferase
VARLAADDGRVAGNRSSRFDGDASLQKRRMKRILDPLALQAPRFWAGEAAVCRLCCGSSEPLPVEYKTPVASAQIKSAVLLCGLNSTGQTTVIEAEASRDHTEKMLAHFGAKVVSEPHGPHGRKITLDGRPEMTAREVRVPADPSSAAFPLVAALIVEGSDIVIEGVMTNPLRSGLLTTLQEMGADVSFENRREDGGEEVADIRARYSHLAGVDVPAARAPSMIDEYPILAVAASFAQGETRMRGLSELRVKESDRLEAVAAGLKANGVDCEIIDDDLIVRGGRVAGGGMVETHLDHRIAMSFLVMGLAAEKKVTVDDETMIATSFPAFRPLMGDGSSRELRHRHRRPRGVGRALARRLAAHYGRASTPAALSRHGLRAGRGLPLDDVEAAVAAARSLSLTDRRAAARSRHGRGGVRRRGHAGGARGARRHAAGLRGAAGRRRPRRS